MGLLIEQLVDGLDQAVIARQQALRLVGLVSTQAMGD
jgi:hypothetical protein